MMKTAEPKTHAPAAHQPGQATQSPFLAREEGQAGYWGQQADHHPFGPAEHVIQSKADHPFSGRQAFFSPAIVQPKLTIGQPGDKYEREADATSERVVAQINDPAAGQGPAIQTQAEEEKIQEKPIFESEAENGGPDIQAKCAECEQEEKLERKEEEAGPVEEVVQEQPIFENEVNKGAPGLQAKCEQCEEDEQVLKKEEEIGADTEILQTPSVFDDPPESTNFAIQAKCEHCEQEEMLQKKEEEVGPDIESLQKQPIIESLTGPVVPEGAPIGSKNVPGPSLAVSSEPGKEEVEEQENEDSSPPVAGKDTPVALIPGTDSQVQRDCIEGRDRERDLVGPDAVQPWRREDLFSSMGESGNAAEPPQTFEAQLHARRGNGVSLNNQVRENMEAAFGADFSQVRVHDDASAINMNRQINARAFTYGSDIFFNQGELDPHSRGGQQLLAHELTHTIQQGAAPIKLAAPGTATQNRSSGRVLQPLVQTAVTDYLPSLRSIIDYIPGLGSAYNFLRDLASSAVNMVRSMASGVLDMVRSVFDSVRSIFNTVREMLENMLRAFIDRLKDMLSEIFSKICEYYCLGLEDVIIRVLNMIASGYEYWQQLKQMVTNAVNRLMAWLSGIWEYAHTLFEQLRNSVSGLYQQFYNTLRSYAPGLAYLVDMFWSFIQEALNWIRRLINEALSFLGGIWSTIQSYIQIARDWLARQLEAAWNYLEHEFPRVFSKLRRIVTFLRDLTRIDWMGPLKRDGFQGDWYAFFVYWFCEMSPESLGTWSSGGEMPTVTIGPGRGYTEDLQSRPHYQLALNCFRERYPNIAALREGDCSNYPFRFTGGGTTTGNYTALEWFMGSYDTIIMARNIDPQSGIVDVQVVVYNQSTWYSATRFPPTWQRQLPILQEWGSIVDSVDRSECGPGGNFAQRFVWTDRIDYNQVPEEETGNRDQACERMGGAPQTGEENQPERRICLPRDVQLFGPRRFDLHNSWSTGNIPLYTEPIEVPYVGIIVLSVYAAGDLSGSVGADIGPSWLSDLCLIHDPSSGTYRGTGTIHVTAGIDGSISATGTIGASANWFCLLEVARIEGGLTATGSGRFEGDLSDTVEVICKNGEISLVNSLDLATCLRLNFDLDAFLRIQLFRRFTVFEDSWNLLNRQWEKCWEHNLLVTPIRLGSLGAGQLPALPTAAAPGQYNTTGSTGGATPALGMGNIDGNDLLQWLLAQGGSSPLNPDTPADPAALAGVDNPCGPENDDPPTGLTEDDPIPIRWFKTERFYPSPIRVANRDYARDDGDATLPMGEPLGVPEVYWPWRGKKFQLIPSGRETGQRDFRATLERYGFDWGPSRQLQADHVQDVQWEGPDEFRNLWPMDGAANMSAGPRQNDHQQVTFAENPGDPPVTMTLREMKRLARQGRPYFGRWFIIREIRF